MQRTIKMLLATFLLTGFTMSDDATADVLELRVYTTHEGKLENLNARFRDHTMRIFENHGMKNIGYWVPEDIPNTLIYVISHKSRDAAKKSWADFVADPEWQDVFKKSRVDGPLLSKAPEATFLESTDYSPKKGWKNKGDDGVFELRIYQAAEGKLGKLDARFRDHTIKLFEKHGMRNLAYWHPTDEPISKDHLYYIIHHKSRDAAKASWQGFIADPEWKKAAAASGVGRLAKPPISIYMKSTDYSQIK